MPIRALFSTFILACLLLVASPSLHAIDIRKLSISELASSSERIVLARCINGETREIPMGIFTFTSFAEEKVLKGSAGQKNFTLRLPGGQVGTRIVDAPGVPTFSKGETVLLFLGKKNRDGFPTLFPQGVFRVMPLANHGAKTGISPIPADLPLMYADSGKPYPSRPDEMPLNDFLYSLSRLLGH